MAKGIFCCWFLLFHLTVNNVYMQLHMIENRHRIENQILLGRQAVRKTLQSRAQQLFRQIQMR